MSLVLACVLISHTQERALKSHKNIILLSSSHSFSPPTSWGASPRPMPAKDTKSCVLRVFGPLPAKLTCEANTPLKKILVANAPKKRGRKGYREARNSLVVLYIYTCTATSHFHQPIYVNNFYTFPFLICSFFLYHASAKALGTSR